MGREMTGQFSHLNPNPRRKAGTRARPFRVSGQYANDECGLVVPLGTVIRGRDGVCFRRLSQAVTVVFADELLHSFPTEFHSIAVGGLFHPSPRGNDELSGLNARDCRPARGFREKAHLELLHSPSLAIGNIASHFVPAAVRSTKSPPTLSPVQDERKLESANSDA